MFLRQRRGAGGRHADPPARPRADARADRNQRRRGLLQGARSPIGWSPRCATTAASGAPPTSPATASSSAHRCGSATATRRFVTSPPPSSGGLVLADALQYPRRLRPRRARRRHAQAPGHRGAAPRLPRPRRVPRRSGLREDPGRAAAEPAVRGRPAHLDPPRPRDALGRAAAGVHGRREPVDHALLGARPRRQPRRRDGVDQPVLRRDLHRAGHGLPAQRHDGRLLGRGRSARTPSSSSARTPTRSRPASARCRR